MEKIVIFALVILSCVTLSGGDPSMTPSPTTPKASVSVMPTTDNTTEASTTKTTTAAGPTSGAVSFTASSGLVVSLVMALLH